MYTVEEVSREDCEYYIRTLHYAKRWPSVTYRYGLFERGLLVGVVTYGTPASSTLRKGVCGEEHADKVIELNRLCLLNNKPNEASMLVGKSLRMLPKSKVVVSYADTSQDHKGYVYQACNFSYCGLSAKRKDWKLRGREHLHGQTISDEFRGVPNRSKLLREKYGDDFYSEDRPRKHRYVYFVGSKRWKKAMRKTLNYKIEQYPK